MFTDILLSMCLERGEQPEINFEPGIGCPKPATCEGYFGYCQWAAAIRSDTSNFLGGSMSGKDLRTTIRNSAICLHPEADRERSTAEGAISEVNSSN